MSEDLRKLFDYIERNSNSYVEELRRFCKQESISAQKKGIEECSELLLNMMKDIGIKGERIRGKGNPVVYGEIKGKKDDYILFYNHYDVQPIEPLEEWVYEPFSAEIRDDRIYARGVADNKGNLMARLMALKSILELYKELPIGLKFFIEGEEEVGSPNLRSYVESMKEKLRAKGCVWEGGDKDVRGMPQTYLGAKGILYVELRINTAGIDQHSMYSTIIPNPAWKLVWLLNTLKDDKENILIEGFYDDVLKPTEEESRMLEEIEFNEEEYRRNFGVKNYLLNRKGLELLKALVFNPTCNISGIEAGYTGKGSKTVNPSWAMAKVDFRLVPKQKPEDILGKLKAHLKRKGFKDIEIIEHGYYAPAKSSINSRIARVTIETSKLAYGQTCKVLPITPGAGPMCYFTDLLDLDVIGGECLGRPDSKIHAPNENIVIKDYIDCIKHVSAIIMRFSALS
ncbi:MAG: M20/M25/M40 family metallo-hydrolase [Nitrososphaerales archaeon]